MPATIFSEDLKNMADFYKNLFRNADEGDASAKIVGHLPDWFNADQVVNFGLSS